MSIYRGIGGSVDATNDALVEEVSAAAVTAIAKAAEASTSASNAATSASNALSSANTATTEASEASTAASQAAASASTASTASVASIAARDAAQIYRDQAESFTPDGYEARLDSLEQGNQLINDLSQAYIFPTVTDFKASLIEFPDGKTIQTRGYYTSGQGGASYLVKTQSKAIIDEDVIDEIVNHTLTAGVVAILQPSNNLISAEQAGLVGDGSDELDRLLSFHAFALRSGSDIVLGHKRNYGALLTEDNPHILLDKSIKIDMNYSTITCLNDGNTSLLLNVYRITKGSSTTVTDFLIKNGTIRAPLMWDELPTPVPFPPFNDLKDAATGLCHNIGTWHECGDVNATFENIKFLGYWGQAALGSGGSLGGATTRHRNGVYHGLDTALPAAFASNLRYVYVDIENCQIQGHNNQGPDWYSRGRCLYLHPNVNLKVSYTTFKGAGRTQINHYSASLSMSNVESGQTQPPDETTYIDSCTFTGSDFAPGQGAMLTTNLGPALTVFSDCVFDFIDGVEQRTAVEMHDNSVINGGCLYTAHSANPRYPEFNRCVISGGVVEKARQGAASVITKFLNAGDQKQYNDLTIKGVTFKGGGLFHESVNTLRVENCKFYADDPKNTTFHFLEGPFVLSGCQFLGQSEAGPFHSDGKEPGGVIDNCLIDMAAWGNINLVVNPTAGETITLDDGVNTQIFTFGGNVAIGITVEETCKNLVGAINNNGLSLSMTAFDRGDGSCYVTQPTAVIKDLVPITENSASIIVEGMSVSKFPGVIFKGVNVTGNGNTFKNAVLPEVSFFSSANLGIPNSGDPLQRTPEGTRLYISPNHNFTQVLGVANIQDLRFDRTSTASKVFNGCEVTLYSVDGFNMTDLGNIVLKGSSPTNYPVGSFTKFRYFADTHVWVEQ